jgi:hypothetical protein
LGTVGLCRKVGRVDGLRAVDSIGAVNLHDKPPHRVGRLNDLGVTSGGRSSLFGRLD